MADRPTAIVFYRKAYFLSGLSENKHSRHLVVLHKMDFCARSALPNELMQTNNGATLAFAFLS